MIFSRRQKILSWLRKFKIRTIAPCVSFGSNVYVGPGCTIDGIYGLVVGDNVYIGKRVTLEFEGTIGNGVIIANNVGIIGRRDHDAISLAQNFFDARTVRNNRELSLKTEIGDGCWIGFGAIILSGVKIGPRCIIGAGAVVTQSVPEGSVVTPVGNLVKQRVR